MRNIVFVILTLISTSCFSQKAGFYKKVIDPSGIFISEQNSDTNHYSMQYAPNGVHGGSWTLKKKDRLTYNYPVHGWWWADTRIEAKNILGLKKDCLKLVDDDEED